MHSHTHVIMYSLEAYIGVFNCQFVKFYRRYFCMLMDSRSPCRPIYRPEVQICGRPMYLHAQEGKYIDFSLSTSFMTSDPQNVPFQVIWKGVVLLSQSMLVRILSYTLPLKHSAHHYSSVQCSTHWEIKGTTIAYHVCIGPFSNKCTSKGKEI